MKGKTKDGPDYISPALRPMAVPIGSLHPDPDNVRLHGERNLAAIQASLDRFGQQAPVVYVLRDRRKIVVKGNGLLASAKLLGWKHLAAVQSGLEGPDLKAYAIADNRTTDLSEFDEELLATQLRELDESGFDIEAAGFEDDEFDELSRHADKLAAAALAMDNNPGPLGTGADAGGGAKVEQASLHRPPSLTWVLVGIPTVRFADVNDQVETLASVPGATVRVKVQDERSLEPPEKQYKRGGRKNG